MSRPTIAAGLVLALGLLPLADAGFAEAQEKALSIELNNSADEGGGCRLTFVAKNDTDAVLDKAPYEVAIFDANKQVAKLLIFEFGPLPKGKTKVVEFVYPSLDCKGISRILVNTSPECVAAQMPSSICLDNLKTSTLTAIAFDQ